MDEVLVDVLGSGAVVLGPDVTCDGFHANHAVRVQTHAHSDHMKDFPTSLRGQVVLTKATMGLLGQTYPNLDVRTNVHALELGRSWSYRDTTIQLYSSGHMLGAAQVRLELPNGIVLGYSGDFAWPLKNTIQVDQLVVDGTYGSPDSDRKYSQEQVEERFVELVAEKLRDGPVHLAAFPGVAERALDLLCRAEIDHKYRIVVNNKTEWCVGVHRKFPGWFMPEVCCEESSGARLAQSEGRYVRVWGIGSRALYDDLYPGVVIHLTKYRTNPEPVEEMPNGNYRVGFSNHADFTQTLEYVEATGASHVVTDGLRGERGRSAEQLAKAIRVQLGIAASVSTNQKSNFWGE